MKSTAPKLLIVLIAVIIFAAYIKISNPNKKYSTEDYWLSATLEDVRQIPEEAILPGNKNGSVLMWAAMVTKDPHIISALVSRGSDINESDIIFSGTPLSAAAGYSSTPVIIDELISNGAAIDKVVGSNNKTPLIIAAELNSNPGITERLVYHGADVNYKDLTGRTALEQAIRFKNNSVIEALRKQTQEPCLARSLNGWLKSHYKADIQM